MHPHLLSVAIAAYVCAMGLALAYIVQRQPLVHRLSALVILVGWIAHTLALVVHAVEIGGPPLGTLTDAVSVSVWVVVLLEMLVERQAGVTVLGAFVMQTLAYGLNFTRVNSAVQNIVAGIVLVVAVGFDTFNRRRAR